MWQAFLTFSSLLCVFTTSVTTLPTSNLRNDKGDRGGVSPSGATSDNKIYGSEPYQLQFQERQHSHQHQHDHQYYPSPSTQVSQSVDSAYQPNRQYQQHQNQQHQQYHPYRHSSHQYQQSLQRQRTNVNQQNDYDPFYFSARNGVLPAIPAISSSVSNVYSGGRTRRNSKFRDLFGHHDDSSNLLNEDVHFFRREQKPRRHESESSAEVRFHKDSQRILPQYFPAHPASSASRTPTGFHPHDPSSFNTVDRRGHYPLGSNHLDFYDSHRHHPNIPKLFVPEREQHRYGREPIEGWSVQVGTQLRVHDDGRERNPAQFYVKDEKPANTRRYPHRHDYI